MAIQRDVMTNQLYGETGTVATNLLAGPTAFVSKNTSWKYDIDAAEQAAGRRRLDEEWQCPRQERCRDEDRLFDVGQRSAAERARDRQARLRPDRGECYDQVGRCQRLLLFGRRQRSDSTPTSTSTSRCTRTVRRSVSSRLYGGVLGDPSNIRAEGECLGREQHRVAGRTPTTTRRTWRRRPSSIQPNRHRCSSR